MEGPLGASPRAPRYSFPRRSSKGSKRRGFRFPANPTKTGCRSDSENIQLLESELLALVSQRRRPSSVKKVPSISTCGYTRGVLRQESNESLREWVQEIRVNEFHSTPRWLSSLTRIPFLHPAWEDARPETLKEGFALAEPPKPSACFSTLRPTPHPTFRCHITGNHPSVAGSSTALQNERVPSPAELDARKPGNLLRRFHPIQSSSHS